MTAGPGPAGPDPYSGAQGPGPGAAAAPGAPHEPAGYGWHDSSPPSSFEDTAVFTPRPGYVPMPPPDPASTALYPAPGYAQPPTAPYSGAHAAPAPGLPGGHRPGADPAHRAGTRARHGRHGAAEKAGLGGFLRELPFLLVIGFGIVVFVKAFLIQAFYIPSGSMEQTLLVNDRVLVNRQAYLFGEPQRGDVVVFRNWDDVGQDVEPESVLGYIGRSLREGIGLGPSGAKQDLIKRIVALPGETVEVRNSRAIVNGVPLAEPYVRVDGPDPLANFGPRVVPEGHYFMLGDHRNNSADSRANGGRYTDADAIVGRAFLRIWPLGRIGGLGGPPTPQAAPTTGEPDTASLAAGMLPVVPGRRGRGPSGGSSRRLENGAPREPV